MAVNNPPALINAYLSEKVSEALPQYFNGKMRFFPSMPVDINSLTDSFPEATTDVFGIYDRMFRMRKRAFPHIKCEQVLYYLYKMSGDIEALIESTQIIYELMDREDETAIEINAWLRSKMVNGVITIGDKEFNPIHFHGFKMYQLQETRDVINFNTTRSFVGNKVIIEYDYHLLNK